MTEDPPPQISVVIPAYEAWRTLPQVLDALAPQVAGREVILVESSGGTGAAVLARTHPWLNVVALPQRCLPGRARNIGVERARGETLAFLDADTVPSPGWLDALEASLVDGVDAAGGAILNGTPWHPVGTAGYLLEFTEWLPNRREPLGHAASANLVVRRPALEAVGGFPEDLFPGEDTLVTFAIARRGCLAFAPHARVTHLNRTSGREFFRHQRRLGAAFAAVCNRSDFPHRRFGRFPLALLAPALRVLSLARRVRGSAAEAVQTVAFLPVILLGLLGWTAGVLRPAVDRPYSRPRSRLWGFRRESDERGRAT